MTEVWRLYDTHAHRFDCDRGRTLMELNYLDQVASRLPAGARVLDLGCGSGEPIARFFIERGFGLIGVDAAPTMVAICRERFPQATWIVADMRSLALDSRFDAIIAWDSFFHLTREEQRAMFPRFTKHVEPGGLLLFTSGPAEGEAIGELYGAPLYHASLCPDEYRALLAAGSFRVLSYRPEDPACGLHTVWLAQYGARADGSDVAS